MQQPLADLNDDFERFDFLVGSPSFFQGLIKFLDPVSVVLLGKVQKLPVGALTHTHTVNK